MEFMYVLINGFSYFPRLVGISTFLTLLTIVFIKPGCDVGFKPMYGTCSVCEAGFVS